MNKYFQKIRLTFFMVLIWFFLLLLLFIFILEGYLFHVQRNERIKNIEDFTNYKLSYYRQKRCQVKEKFSIDETTYYYDCLENIYLSYGQTKYTLEELMISNYITLDDLLTFTIKTDNKNEYIHYPKDDNLGYKIVIREEEEKKSVTISSYE